jgi:hypothetical protein
MIFKRLDIEGHKNAQKSQKSPRLQNKAQNGIIGAVSPTVFRYKSYRFLFFSREEKRCHIHVIGPEGEAKFWIEPKIATAENFGLSERQLGELRKVVEERKDEIKNAWEKHFRC